MSQPISLTQPGRFVIGCNYWASHAGTAMWSDWRPDIVEADMKQLSESGLQVLRIFPLWPDFQPIQQLYGGGGQPYEIRLNERPLSYDNDGSDGSNDNTSGAGQAGISTEAMARFAVFAALAHMYNLKLIVGLLTGWMSGRLFVPPALEGRNILTDPVALMWETRFVGYFVRRFKDHPAILAWDLGNECNCMASVPSHEAAWAWTAIIANAIRAEDKTRPIVSGMHSLDEPDENGFWRIADQAELTDVLTTHPYPYFTPHCDQEPVNTIRNGLHATAQTRWYADIGGKPGLAEEVGTLGPMFASEKVAADYLRMTLFSLWANDCHGLLWWCAYDQAHLTHAPYDWTPIERELGLFHTDRTAKLVVAELGSFRRFLDGIPVSTLPPRITEAVCIMTHGQEQWGAAYASFILAKQAGFDLVFQYANQPLKEANLYLMPSVSGGSPFTRHFWTALEERVRNGATLYLSHKDCVLSPFKEPFGLEIHSREHRTSPVKIAMEDLPEEPIFTTSSPIKLHLESTRAEILGREADGNPAFSCATYGKGRFYFLSIPIEQNLSSSPGAFIGADAQPYWQIYRYIARHFAGGRVIIKDHPMVGVTEHALSEERRLVIAINYSPSPLNTSITLAGGWKPVEAWYGVLPSPNRIAWRCSIGANDALVFIAEKSIDLNSGSGRKDWR